MFIAALFTHQSLEAAQILSIGRQINCVAHPDNGILLSTKKK
jgi:hypothetical protein